jgi:hypothetical protein
MWRYPDGVHREGWWQKECRGAPPWVRLYDYTGKASIWIRGSTSCRTSSLDVLNRVGRDGDLFAPALTVRQKLVRSARAQRVDEL